ncbi:hypothetical protein QTP70_018653, partial [Hemibagrus guttatus]
IAFFEEGQNVESLSHQWGFETSDIEQLGPHEFFIPGMVDTHIHASQYIFSGTHLDLPLLDWLKTYTFPVELCYEDLDFAKDAYTKVVKRTLSNGTTTACYFATIHTDASLLLGQIADDFGQRALIGKVCMDRNSMVPDYKELTEGCKDEMDRFVHELLKKKYALVKPVVTPRFAISCSSSLLSNLGKIAKNYDLHIQSHISENKQEVQFVKELFTDCTSYTDVYVKHGLLTDKFSVANWERFWVMWRVISTRLISGMLNVRNVLKHKVKLGLGTDVAGGYSSSMLDAIRRAVDTSKALCMQDTRLQPLSYKEAFRLATLGGSEVLSLDDCIGNFEVGKDFDALHVNICVPGSPIDLFPGDDPEVILEKFLNLGDDRNIVKVYVAGKQVVPFHDSK